MSEATRTKERTRYPEHEKLKAVREISQQLCEFLLEWCPEHGLELAKRGPKDRLDGCLEPNTSRTEDLVAEFLGIDLRKIETEKRAMLDALRQVNGAP